jgi:hypothetical protein
LIIEGNPHPPQFFFQAGVGWKEEKTHLSFSTWSCCNFHCGV